MLMFCGYIFHYRLNQLLAIIMIKQAKAPKTTIWRSLSKVGGVVRCEVEQREALGVL